MKMWDVGEGQKETLIIVPHLHNPVQWVNKTE